MSDYFNVTGTIGFSCDVCGRELQGCTWVNGMRFCAKCYQETFGNTNPFEKELRDKIADLEEKLSKSEERYKKAYQEGLLQKQFDKDMEIDQLKQQLAEKKHSIEMLNQHLTDKAIEIERLGEELAENKKESDDYVMSAIETNVDLKNRLTQAQKERELDNSFWKQECDSLQKALAEKEKEIEEMRHFKVTIGTMGNNQVDISSTTYTDQAKTDFAIEQILDIKEKSFGTRETKLVFDIPPVQDVFDNIESKLKELMGDKYE